MSELNCYGKPINNIFDLFGNKEDDITRSIAWVFSNCQIFTELFVFKALNIHIKDFDNILIRFQEHTKSNGITDIEIIESGNFHIIIEAKRGWNLPSSSQLNKYLMREDFRIARNKKIITMSECSDKYAKINLPFTEKDGVEIKHLSWKDVYQIAKKSIRDSSNIEKQLLNQLIMYLEGVMTMQNKRDNMAYICVLSDSQPSDSKLSYREITKKYNIYFHPIGHGYPKEPLNYVAFRYNGKLQSIHHIEKYQIVYDIHELVPELKSKKEEYGLYVYELGKPIFPPKEIKNHIKGKEKAIWSNQANWSALDLLLTCDSIKEAILKTKERLSSEE